MAFALKKDTQIWLQWKDNCVELTGKIFNQTPPSPSAALFTAQPEGQPHMFKAVTGLDGTAGTIGARFLDTPSPEVLEIFSSEAKTCEILYRFSGIRFFCHAYLILSNLEITTTDGPRGIWTVSASYEIEKDAVLFGNTYDEGLPNWSYDAAPNNDLISGPTAVSIDLANTEFVMLIQDKDGTAGDVAIGAAHELDILFTPDAPSAGNWVWNNMPDGTPTRFGDPSPQAVIYRTKLTHLTDPYPDGAVTGVLSFSNSATSGFYRNQRPEQYVRLWRKLKN